MGYDFSLNTLPWGPLGALSASPAWGTWANRQIGRRMGRCPTVPHPIRGSEVKAPPAGCRVEVLVDCSDCVENSPLIRHFQFHHFNLHRFVYHATEKILVSSGPPGTRGPGPLDPLDTRSLTISDFHQFIFARAATRCNGSATRRVLSECERCSVIACDCRVLSLVRSTHGSLYHFR